MELLESHKLKSCAVLIRTNYCDDRLIAFAHRLRQESGHPVFFVADETRGHVNTGDFTKIVFDPATLKKMGLYTTGDTAWRCGDYFFYIARRALPQFSFMWIIEPDTRINYANLKDFFDQFINEDADLIAPHLMKATSDYWWYSSMACVSPIVWRCLFGLVRMSARAMDLCILERKRLSRRLETRIMWANDEVFTSSTLMRKGFETRDLNSFGNALCTLATFNFDSPISGEVFERFPEDRMIYHPVLFGKLFDRKMITLASIRRSRSRNIFKRLVDETSRMRLQRGIVKLLSGRIPIFSTDRTDSI